MTCPWTWIKRKWKTWRIMIENIESMSVKFYEYLKSLKLIKKYQPRSSEYDNLFVDGMNIFGFFKDSPRKPYDEVIDVIYILLPKRLVYVSMDGRSPNPKIQRQVEQGKERYIPDHEKLTSIELNKIHGIIRRCYIALFEIKKKKVIF